MKTPLFGLWLTVERLAGFGGERVDVSLREPNEKGQPGKRIKAQYGMNRAMVIAAAFALLDVADQMLADSTFATSDALPCNKGESQPLNSTFQKLRAEAAARAAGINPSERAADMAVKFERLRGRLPTLQLAQRVLENCGDDVHQSLAALLMLADNTNALPFSAGVEIVPAGSSLHAMVGDDGDGTTRH